MDAVGAQGRGPTRGEAHQRSASRTRRTTNDRDEAEQVITELYLPNRLDLSSGPAPLALDVSALRMGALTAGRLTYRRRVRLRTAEADHFHVNIALRGRAASRSGTSDPVATGPGEGLVFSPGAPAEMSWSADCEQLCLMVPRACLETELERLIGRSVRGRLSFEFAADLQSTMGRRWRTVLNLLVDELDDPTDMGQNPHVSRHVEALVLDGLLLGQSHSHSDVVGRDGPVALSASIKRAVDLVEEQPSEPWTSVRLATEVHLSVRALQSGFHRDLGVPPMTYLRQVRLRRARESLQAAERHSTTVRAVATQLGILHMSRFAAAYREAFGETPSDTLNRHG